MTDFETIFGIAISVIWFGLILWALAELTVTAIKGEVIQGANLAGVLFGCALGAGLVLMFKKELPHDTFGKGFVLAFVGSVGVLRGYYSNHRHYPSSPPRADSRWLHPDWNTPEGRELREQLERSESEKREWDFIERKDARAAAIMIGVVILFLLLPLLPDFIWTLIPDWISRYMP